MKGNGYTFKGDNFDYCLSLPSENGSALKRSKFFPFRVDCFSEGVRVQEGKEEVTKVVSLEKNSGKVTKCIQYP